MHATDALHVVAESGEEPLAYTLDFAFESYDEIWRGRDVLRAIESSKQRYAARRRAPSAPVHAP